MVQVGSCGNGDCYNYVPEMIYQNFYLEQQIKLHNSKLYQSVCVFFGIYSVIVLFIIGLYLIIKSQLFQVGLVLLIFALARGVVSPLIFLFIKRQRPYQKFHFKTYYSRLLSAYTDRPTSFPSDHAISLAAISFALWWFYPVLGWLLLLLVLLNGLARIVLGYHYITDVLAGWFLGLLFAWVILIWIVPK